MPNDQTTDNPFEPVFRCGRCQDTHRIRIPSMRMPVGRLPAIGTPQSSGADVEITYAPCPECSK